jgi:hypothetical protein
MGFDCIVCGDREIWSFESAIPEMCQDCYVARNNPGKKPSAIKPNDPALGMTLSMTPDEFEASVRRGEFTSPRATDQHQRKGMM